MYVYKLEHIHRYIIFVYVHVHEHVNTTTIPLAAVGEIKTILQIYTCIYIQLENARQGNTTQF